MFPLVDVIANRSWLHRSSPFHHVVARNLFQPDFYDLLAAQLQEILARGLSEVPARKRFSRSIPGYDAYGFGFPSSTTGALSVFVSTAWRDMMCRLFGVPATPYIFAGAHHHLVGSRRGWIHNDLNPVWFPRQSAGEIQTPDPELCSYRTGAGCLHESEKVVVVRGAVAIFFLLNDGWRSGDGGEVGLFTSALQSVSQPCTSWPPVNNGLIAFECTPDSFHSFLSNTRLPRTSLIMWIHRPMDEAVSKFGKKALELWK